MLTQSKYICFNSIETEHGELYNIIYLFIISNFITHSVRVCMKNE